MEKEKVIAGLAFWGAICLTVSAFSLLKDVANHYLKDDDEKDVTVDYTTSEDVNDSLNMNY